MIIFRHPTEKKIAIAFEELAGNKAELTDIVRVTMDAGVGVPFTCLMTREEANQGLKALKEAKWAEEVRTESTWKL